MKKNNFAIIDFIFALIIVFSASVLITYNLHFILKLFSDIEFNVTPEYTLLFTIYGLFLWYAVTHQKPEKGSTRILSFINSKIEGWELKTRYMFRNFLSRLGFILLFGVFFSGVTLLINELESLLVFTYPFIIIGWFFIFFSPFFITNKQIALLFFIEFRDNKYHKEMNLRKALRHYNRSVNYRFSPKKLSSIIQYVTHSCALDLEDCENEIHLQIDSIINCLENKQYGEIPKILSKLQMDSDLLLERLENLGLEIQYSNWIQIKEIVASNFMKTLPQLFWLLIVVGAYLILNLFVEIDIFSLI